MKTTLAVSLLAVSLVAVTSVRAAATAAESWDDSCAKCHGADGTGSTKMGQKLHLKDYTDAAVQAAMKDEDMFKAIKEGVTEDGKERMKAFKDDFSDAEINDLVVYVRQMRK
jgi:cytochrome c553